MQALLSAFVSDMPFRAHRLPSITTTILRFRMEVLFAQVLSNCCALDESTHLGSVPEPKPQQVPDLCFPCWTATARLDASQMPYDTWNSLAKLQVFSAMHNQVFHNVLVARDSKSCNAKACPIALARLCEVSQICSVTNFAPRFAQSVYRHALEHAM